MWSMEELGGYSLGVIQLAANPDQNGSGMRKTFVTYGKDFVMKILSIVFLG